jgi:hypothetical protein
MRGFARLDLASDPPVADLHFQLIDCDAGREREHIASFDPILALVRESLGHVDARYVRGDTGAQRC